MRYPKERTRGLVNFYPLLYQQYIVFCCCFFFFLLDQLNLMCFSNRRGHMPGHNQRQIGLIFLQSQFVMKFWRRKICIYINNLYYVIGYMNILQTSRKFGPSSQQPLVMPTNAQRVSSFSSNTETIWVERFDRHISTGNDAKHLSHAELLS